MTRWVTVAQQRHAVRRTEAARGIPVIITMCGYRVWQTTYDTRMTGPTVCLSCAHLTEPPTR
ncbi:hypothetical protein SAMN06265360_107232 [Haloechinothrix alba]|uniref:Uncharacterized protein n=1 Tax=Haloechinothrix alba TaxID=664784 RepID=A0A238WUP9_9PSEU|nr:hypothetical protein [Haloechinothrix alba]SNR50111.1 hypothetical protein SAMN06265360_107232 [Haloechinothrix alba]